jgi:hypothetical protein
MPSLSLPVARTIRENVAILLTHGLSRSPLQSLVDQRFEGGFKQFRETAFAFAEQRAERACIELAVLLRYLDDEQNISATYEGRIAFGYLTKSDGTVVDLTLRDVTNKIIHARGFEWDTSKSDSPKLICHPRDDQAWKLARVSIVELSVACGSLTG